MKKGRAKKSESEKRVTVSGLVLPETERFIDSLAFSHDRTRSYIVDKLIVRGIAAVMRDGNLDENPRQQVIAKTA